MSSLFSQPWQQVFDCSGNTLAGAKLYFYTAGTSNPKNVYSDVGLNVPLTNPVVANGSGRFVPIYMDDEPYKVALYTAEDKLIWTADNMVVQPVDADVADVVSAVKQVVSSAGYNAEAFNPNTFPMAIFKYANSANWYTETGTDDNAYILTGLDTYSRPVDYFVGMKIAFISTRPNTGNATINVVSLGTKNIRNYDGSDLNAGQIQGVVNLVYNGATFIVDKDFEPTGTILPFAGETAPFGYLFCDGSAVSRTDYGALFAVIGTSYGSGDGSTTFNLPDYRDRTVFMRSDKAVGNTSDGIIPDHRHTISVTTGATGWSGGGANNGTSYSSYASEDTSLFDTSLYSQTVNKVIPSHVSCNFIIRY